MNEETNQDRIARIIAAFERSDGVYQRAAMDEAVALREEITPHLIRVLEQAESDPEAFIQQDRWDHLYAAQLLRHFHEVGAHQVILALFSKPKDIVEELFGDCVSEDLPFMLHNTCGAKLEGIKALILNKDAYVYCRMSAIQAMAFATVDGLATWDETQSFLASLLTGTEAELESPFWSEIVHQMGQLWPGEYASAIQQALEQNLVDPMWIHAEFADEQLAKGQEACWLKISELMARGNPEDVHDLMSWWACFNEAAPLSPVPSSLPDLPKVVPAAVPQIVRKDKAAKKKARKQAKASRKRNRK